MLNHKELNIMKDALSEYVNYIDASRNRLACEQRIQLNQYFSEVKELHKKINQLAKETIDFKFALMMLKDRVADNLGDILTDEQIIEIAETAQSCLEDATGININTCLDDN